MTTLKIEGTDDSPDVTLDKENSIFQISGQSLPENVVRFYEPILAWIDEYASAPNDETKFEFKLDYFNTASAKLILDILLKFEKIHKEGNSVLIAWHYLEEDEDMRDSGEAYGNMIETPFEQIPY